ncbi:Chek2 [Symbiodinium microadriaticum]|nr:Chek2 [Symbiodinium microadriaticum]
MELVRGGELFDAIVSSKTLNEVEAKYIFRQLLEGVGYMHSKNVIHRDLKPENILIGSSMELPPPLTGTLREVKIADFGLSKIINEGSSLAKTFVGTPQYWAPEVLNVQRGGGVYTQAADFWSLGAVLFVMLGGRYPFDGKAMPLEEQIRTASYSMTSPAWQRVSEEAKDMVRGLLKVNPNDRLKLEDCIVHPWMGGGGVPPALDLPREGLQMPTDLFAEAPAAPVPIVTHPPSTSDLSARSDSWGSRPKEKAKSGSSAKAAGTPASDASATAQLPVLGVPMVSVNAEPEQDEELIFCLNELLKLQVSISSSLEVACLAFRHADRDLSDNIRRAFNEANQLSQTAAAAVSNYAQVAQQVSRNVLPDLKLAIQEKEPNLAVSLLGIVKEWVSNMKKDGEQIQQQYSFLQQELGMLSLQSAECNSHEATLTGGLLNHCRSRSPTSTANHCLAEALFLSKAKGRVAQDSAMPARHWQITCRNGSRTCWTCCSWHQVWGETRCRNLLLFSLLRLCHEWTLLMRSGICIQVPVSSLPLQPTRCDEQEVNMEDAQADVTNANAIVQHNLCENEKAGLSAQDFVQNTSGCLLRALRELKRVDEILQGCSAFWANMDGTVQKLAQMKEHTECLVNYANSSRLLKERFDQRLAEYTTFWTSLERLCRQYCIDYQTFCKKMQDTIRDVSDTADVYDTAQSVRMGVANGYREKAMRSGGYVVQ